MHLMKDLNVTVNEQTILSYLRENSEIESSIDSPASVTTHRSLIKTARNLTKPGAEEKLPEPEPETPGSYPSQRSFGPAALPLNPGRNPARKPRLPDCRWC
ncbi:hypothetical protein CEXT_35911 [Caerostris extrusa]|uniref:Uncharacterized protein n=1 Tax=Caerostris extrusa TaxID=172846 RepID=A0AAV4ME44_CAEEX|nr:hypothetical protein CEXT_35911 [Caerostris extrusa]